MRGGSSGQGGHEWQGRGRALAPAPPSHTSDAGVLRCVSSTRSSGDQKTGDPPWPGAFLWPSTRARPTSMSVHWMVRAPPRRMRTRLMTLAGLRSACCTHARREWRCGQE